MKGGATFFQESAKNIMSVGAVAPSSPFLVKTMTKHVDFKEAIYLVELGAGTGVLTKELLSSMRADATLLCFETNPKFIKLLKEIKDSRLKLIEDSAVHMGKYLQRKADYILSGIPIGGMDAKEEEALLDTIASSLASQGKYIQFQYSLLSRKRIKQRFANVEYSGTILNIPPALVYVCSAE